MKWTCSLSNRWAILITDQPEGHLKDQFKERLAKNLQKILVFLRVCDAQFTSFTTENAFVGVHDQKFLLYGKENFRGLLKMHSKTKILTSLKSVKLRIKNGC